MKHFEKLTDGRKYYNGVILASEVYQGDNDTQEWNIISAEEAIQIQHQLEESSKLSEFDQHDAIGAEINEEL